VSTIFARARASSFTDSLSSAYSCLSTWFRFTDAIATHPHSRCHITLPIKARVRPPFTIRCGPWWWPKRRTSHPSRNAWGCRSPDGRRTPMVSGSASKPSYIGRMTSVSPYGRCVPLTLSYLLFAPIPIIFLFINVFTYRSHWYALLASSYLSPSLGTLMELHFGLDLFSDFA